MSKQAHFILNQIKNIGDVVLCLPLASLLKQAIPTCKITLLCQAYTFPIAQSCPDIDEVMDWFELEKKRDQEIITRFKNSKATCIIHLANNKRIAKLAYHASIKQRVGTSQRVYHWLYCNCKINQARRHSTLHELQLNSQMLNPLQLKGIQKNYDKATLIEHLNLKVPFVPLPTNIKHQLKSQKKKVILHPGSNGHGREWPIEHFISLAHTLNKMGFQVIFTGSAGEGDKFQRLIDECPFALNSFGQLSIEQLLVLINKADVFIGAGTGPTHIAGALNKATIGLFPPRKGISPRRWAPPGKNVVALIYNERNKPCFACRESEGCLCMKKITVQQVIDAIEKILTNNTQEITT